MSTLVNMSASPVKRSPQVPLPDPGRLVLLARLQLPLEPLQELPLPPLPPAFLPLRPGTKLPQLGPRRLL